MVKLSSAPTTVRAEAAWYLANRSNIFTARFKAVALTQPSVGSINDQELSSFEIKSASEIPGSSTLIRANS